MATTKISQSPTDPAFVQDPYSAYASFRDYEAVWWEEYGMWVFPRSAEVSAIFRDRRFGREILHVATREELGWSPIPEHLEPFYAFEANSLLEREPPAHTRLRSLINRAFVSRRIEDMRPRIAGLARQLCSGLREGDDLIKAYCEPIPITIIAELLGVPVEMAPQLLAWSHDMVAMYQARRDHQIEQAAVAATLAFSEYMDEWIGQRRQALGTDLLSALIAAEEAGDRLSTKELIATSILLLNAGHEATVHALGNSIRTLALTGETVTEGSAPDVVEELLRYDPPLHMFTRYALEDIRLGAVELRKGDQVGLLIGSANHDSRVNPNPGFFDPSRQRPQHHSFGAGLHFCVGAPLARLEMQIALSELCRMLGPELPVSIGKYRNTYHFRGLTELRVGNLGTRTGDS